MLNGMNERLPTLYIFVHNEYHAMMPSGRTNETKRERYASSNTIWMFDNECKRKGVTLVVNLGVRRKE